MFALHEDGQTPGAYMLIDVVIVLLAASLFFGLLWLFGPR